MTTSRLPFFLALARAWRATADVRRAAGVPDNDPALRVWREAAWCHVLYGRGQYSPALASLRAVAGAVTGEPPDATPPTTEVEAVATATDLFERLRVAVSTHYSHAFGHPAAA